MSLRDDTRKLITEHHRRLQKLKERQARFGFNTPPEVLTEIEDIEAEIKRLQGELGSLESGEGEDLVADERSRPPAGQTSHGDYSAKTGQQYDVFLSHNSQDKPAVEALAQRLIERGLTPFLDKWHLIPGEPWQEALEEALDACQTVAVFLGPSGISPWENAEMRSALEDHVWDKSRRVIPVLLPGAPDPREKPLPRFLRRMGWVDFRNGLEDEDAFHRLCSGIRGIPPGPPPAGAKAEPAPPVRRPTSTTALPPRINSDAPPIAAIRDLLLAAFTPEDLRRFCQDRSDFRSILARFGPGQGLDDMVDRVIDHCQTRLMWDELLAEVAQVNPRQYARFESRLRG